MDHVTVGKKTLFSFGTVILSLRTTQANLEKKQCSKTKYENYKIHLRGQVTQAMRGCAARTWEESHTPRNFEIGQGQYLLMFISWRTESADVQRQIVGRLCHEILQKKFCKMGFSSYQMETLHAMHIFSSNIDSVTITKRSRLLKYSNTDQRAMWMTIFSQSVTHL